jgi:hypothetical protein
MRVVLRVCIQVSGKLYLCHLPHMRVSDFGDSGNERVSDFRDSGSRTSEILGLGLPRFRQRELLQNAAAFSDFGESVSDFGDSGNESAERSEIPATRVAAGRLLA